MLTLKNIYWRPDDGEDVLKGIDLTIPTGKLTVITGPNGGGKTSLARVIAGINKADEGQILLDDIDITDEDITERANLGVTYAFQQPVRFKGITVRKLLELSAGGELPDEDICSIFGKVGLCTQDYIDREVSASLSGGEIKRIEIASALAKKNSRVLMFDEPEAGIDLWSFAGLIDTFESLKKEQDKTLLVISHQERLLRIADEIAVIADGKVRISGTRDEVMPQLMEGDASGVCPLGKEWLADE